MDLLTQFIGLIALIVGLSVNLIKNDKYLKIYAATGSSIWATHFYMLGAITDSMTCIAISFRQLTSIFFDKEKSHLRTILVIFFCILFSTITTFTWMGPVSILPWIASINGTFAFFYLKGIKFRSVLLISDSAWLLSAIIHGSMGMCATAIIGISLKIWTIHRLMQDQKMQPIENTYS